jgi:hypothetical protein
VFFIARELVKEGGSVLEEIQHWITKLLGGRAPQVGTELVPLSIGFLVSGKTLGSIFITFTQLLSWFAAQKVAIATIVAT